MLDRLTEVKYKVKALLRDKSDSLKTVNLVSILKKNFVKTSFRSEIKILVHRVEKKEQVVSTFPINILVQDKLKSRCNFFIKNISIHLCKAKRLKSQKKSFCIFLEGWLSWQRSKFDENIFTQNPYLIYHSKGNFMVINICNVRNVVVLN